MNTFTPLRDLDYVSAYVLYVSLFFWAASAYKRTKQKGFTFLAFSALGFLLNSPMPFQPSRPAGHAAHGYTALYFDLAHGLQLTNNTLMVIGIVLVIKGYLALFNTQAGAETNPAAGEAVEAGSGGGGSGENPTL